MPEDEIKKTEQKHKTKEKATKNHSNEKDGKTIKTEEQRKTRKQPTRDSRNKKRMPSRKRVIETTETMALSSAIQSDSEDNGVKEEQLVHRLDSTTITIDGTKYEIVKNYKEAFDGERLGERYSEILDKYDFIVADWGFEQLRLKGFYDNRNRKVPQDQRISNLEDYLYEYCNFGCPYFVLHRLEAKKSNPKKELADKTEKPVRRKRNQKSKNATNQKQERKETTMKSEIEKDKEPTIPKPKPKSKPKPKPKPKPKRDFVKKEVNETSVEKKEEQENATFKPTNETKGKRHFSIRRKENEADENKE